MGFDVGLFGARSSVTDWAGVFQFWVRGVDKGHSNSHHEISILTLHIFFENQMDTSTSALDFIVMKIYL